MAMADSFNLLRASGFLILIAISLFVTITAIYQLFKQLQKGQSDPERLTNWNARIMMLIKGVFGQSRLLKNIGSAHHVIIFYGFIIITIVSFEVFIRAFFPNFSLRFLGISYFGLLWIEDILSVGVLLALSYGFINRYFYKPLRFEEKLEHSSGLNRDATIILFMIGIHLIFAQILESVEIYLGIHPLPSAPPITKLMANIWTSPDNARLIEGIVWWIHAFSVWLFLIYIFGTNIKVPKFYPSKHFHIISAPFNVLFASTKPSGRLRPMAKDEESFENLMMSAFEESPETKITINNVDELKNYDISQAQRVNKKHIPFSKNMQYEIITNDAVIQFEVSKNTTLSTETKISELLNNNDIPFSEKKSFAVSKVEDLRWSDMLDLYSCTGCGRCQELCPAYLNHQPLSPKALILNMRERLLEKTSYEYENSQSDFNPTSTLIGDVVPKETLWACTTCGACLDACPVYIDHIDKIIDMRRTLAMVEADLPPNMDTMFNNIEINSNPWGIGKSERDKWAQDLNIKRMKDHPDTDVLFWVGCAGSFDDRTKKVSTSLVNILNKAGVDFAILGKEENCTGDPVRRSGNEYLAVQLMNQNVNLLNSYNFKDVLTFCPHCFNNLANELPDFGGHYRVKHAVDFVNDLIKEKKIVLDTSVPLNITYHDSCYLGRHNGIYSAPREILKNFEGIIFKEMDMNKEKGMCCGAGGARVWFELEGETQAINKTRVAMAEETGADKIGVSCPFCTMMLEDGAKNMQSNLEVIDLLEIVSDNMI